MKVVFDTNVLISAFITEGICTKLLSRARKRQFQLYLSPFILHEFETVLTKKFSASRTELVDVRTILREAIHDIVHPDQKVTKACRDPEDDHVLECSLAIKADYLVTGDADLLEIKQFKGTKIITPRDFELFFVD